MKKKIKYYNLCAESKDKKGEKHIVTVVGKFEQSREWTDVVENVPVELRKKSFVKGELKYPVKMLNRKLTIGLSICHPSDTFDEKYGVELAKRRIEKGENLGSVSTHDVTMLTKDAINGELLVKLVYVADNIDKYIP